VSPVRVTWNRTIGRARSLFSTAFAAGGFLAASAALFAFRLDAGMKAVNPAYKGKEKLAILSPDFDRDFALHFAIGYPF
jgi:hypothetical protein